MNELTPGDVSMCLGWALKHRRQSQGLRLIDVSQRAGLSVPTIRAIERGDASVSFGNYAFVAVLLGASDLFQSMMVEGESEYHTPAKQSRVRLPKRKLT